MVNDMPLDVLKDHIDAVQLWASEMSEAWTNTLVGDYLDRGKESLKKVTKEEDWDKAYDLMMELAELCEHAERKLEDGEASI